MKTRTAASQNGRYPSPDRQVIQKPVKFRSPRGFEATPKYIARPGTVIATGTEAKSANGETELKEGKVEGGAVTFVEMLNIQGMELKVTYTGKVVSADEIKFTRDVAGMAHEELVAKRSK